MKHSFSGKILDILISHYGDNAHEIFEHSQIIKYINHKTVSANKGSKSRGSFANLYAIYVLVEDYINKEYHLKPGRYEEYEGAIFSNLFKRQRELPFGANLQNHALNHRMNQEFKKYFPTCDYTPIIRDTETSRYWINENLIQITVNNKLFNLSVSIIDIIDEYVNVKRGAFDSFISTIENLKNITNKEPQKVSDFIIGLLAPNIDARVFEIVSYAVLKYYFHEQVVYFGYEEDNIQKHNLILYKTGRTNANDGGIDFVMKPLGRFFQVTETTDVKKYFLDIDKIQRFPISFVVKSELSIDELTSRFEEKAKEQYVVKAIVQKYMDAIEEIFNIQKIKTCFDNAIKAGYQKPILDEIIIQSKLEFNYEDEDDDDDDDE